MNTDGTGFHTCKKCHKTESLRNHTTTGHKEGEQLEDRRSVGASSCNCGDGTDQRVQFLMFMMMMMMMTNKLFLQKFCFRLKHLSAPSLKPLLHRLLYITDRHLRTKSRDINFSVLQFTMDYCPHLNLLTPF